MAESGSEDAARASGQKVRLTKRPLAANAASKARLPDENEKRKEREKLFITCSR